MKRISLLLAMAFMVTSALASETHNIYGDNGLWYLINKHKTHLNILNNEFRSLKDGQITVKIANSLDVFYANLTQIENILQNLDLKKPGNVETLIYLYDNMHMYFSLPEDNCQYHTPEQLEAIRSALLQVISIVKESVETLKAEYKYQQVKKTVVKTAKILSLAALATGIVYTIKNHEAIKNKTSELASRFLASDFASQAKKFGSNIYTQGAELFANLSKGTANKWASFADSKAGEVTANAIWRVQSLPYSAKSAVDSLSNSLTFAPDLNIIL